MRLGGPEIILILLVVVLIFGVGKLPQLGKSLGEGIKGFREATGESGNQSATNSSAEVATATTQTAQLTAEEQQQFQEWQEFKKWQASKANSKDQA